MSLMDTVGGVDSVRRENPSGRVVFFFKVKADNPKMAAPHSFVGQGLSCD